MTVTEIFIVIYGFFRQVAGDGDRLGYGCHMEGGGYSKRNWGD